MEGDEAWEQGSQVSVGSNIKEGFGASRPDSEQVTGIKLEHCVCVWGETKKPPKPILTKNIPIPIKIKQILTVRVTTECEGLRIPVKMKSLPQKKNCSVFLRAGTRWPA